MEPVPRVQRGFGCVILRARRRAARSSDWCQAARRRSANVQQANQRPHDM